MIHSLFLSSSRIFAIFALKNPSSAIHTTKATNLQDEEEFTVLRQGPQFIIDTLF